MPDKIFLISEGGALETMVEAPYEKELDLQKLLAEPLDLLPGEQIDPDSPRRWLFISKEVDIADSSDGGRRWSADHVFLDQDGIPTIVETKRSSDTRLRREVVGQLLEYAANAVLYWPVEKLREDFARSCVEQKKDPAIELQSFIQGNSDTNSEKFWETVKLNLAAENIRMILVADEISEETRRIIEFLNGQMRSAEIIAVEIRQFKSGNRVAVVPHVVGQTAKAITAKKGKGAPSKPWDEDLVLTELANNSGEDGSKVLATAKEILRRAKTSVTRIVSSGGASIGRLTAEIDGEDGSVALFHLRTNGKVQYILRDLIETYVFASEAIQMQLLHRLNTIPGNEFSLDDLAKYPQRELLDLSEPIAMTKFKRVFDWIIEKLKEN